jgi:hypothetical protein
LASIRWCVLVHSVLPLDVLLLDDLLTGILVHNALDVSGLALNSLVANVFVHIGLSVTALDLGALIAVISALVVSVVVRTISIVLVFVLVISVLVLVIVRIIVIFDQFSGTGKFSFFAAPGLLILAVEGRGRPLLNRRSLSGSRGNVGTRGLRVQTPVTHGLSKSGTRCIIFSEGSSRCSSVWCYSGP